ncbi:MAG: monovalent cation:proton antiporter-2 (CPA2) family protein [Crocinitomicaceae bacterium]|nr:monovalent cation:proton antiporter-2 (CPA2) family protein [Crocinitomicaceae bacterium]
MHLPILNDILIILLAAVLMVFLLKKIKLPSIIGFLLTGILIGPFGLSLISKHHEIEQMSEIGVMLLLFVIGMELSLKQLMRIKRNVFLGGGLQVLLTISIFAVSYTFLGASWSEAVFAGFIFSLSSTAIVLKTFQDRKEIDTPHAKNALAILIFQDIIVVPMMLLAPILAGEATDPILSLGGLLLKTAIVVLFTWFAAKYLVSPIFYAVAKTDSKELFLLVTLAFCLAVASLTALAGMSAALGAFIAGLIIAESAYSHQATSIILPFRELFTSLFFVSVGMLLDLTFFKENALVILLLVCFLFVVKSIIVGAAVYLLNYPLRTVLLTGFSLFQVGEFAFILSKVGIDYGLLDAQSNQFFLSISIVSMMLTPFVFILSERLLLPFLALEKKYSRKNMQNDSTTVYPEKLQNHLVIIGYGFNGSNLARAAECSEIPYAVVDFNAAIVKKHQRNGLPIIFGDATQEHVLAALCVTNAKAVVLAISDDHASQAIIRYVKAQAPQVHLIVRTRYVKQMGPLYALGADEVIPEEYETSMQIFGQVLSNFEKSEEDIQSITQRIRADHYALFTSFQNVID